MLGKRNPKCSSPLVLGGISRELPGFQQGGKKAGCEEGFFRFSQGGESRGGGGHRGAEVKRQQGRLKSKKIRNWEKNKALQRKAQWPISSGRN